MAKLNPIKKKLKELGFSEYSLRKFRKTQKEIMPEYVVEKQKKINKEQMGHRSYVPQYDYSQLLSIAEAYPEKKPIEIVNWIEEEQSKIVDFTERGISIEAYILFDEVIKIVNAFVGRSYNLQDTIKQYEQFDTETKDLCISQIQEYLDFVHKYPEAKETDGYEGVVGFDLRVLAEMWLL